MYSSPENLLVIFCDRTGSTLFILFFRTLIWQRQAPQVFPFTSWQQTCFWAWHSVIETNVLVTNKLYTVIYCRTGSTFIITLFSTYSKSVKHLKFYLLWWQRTWFWAWHSVIEANVLVTNKLHYYLWPYWQHILHLILPNSTSIKALNVSLFLTVIVGDAYDDKTLKKNASHHKHQVPSTDEPKRI